LKSTGHGYDPDWWAKQLLEREKLSVLPPSLEIRRVVEKGLAELPAMQHERAVRERIRDLNAKILKINSQVTLGPPSTQPVLDEEAEVERWRASRRR
jgi:hypothetical protein